VFNLNTNVQHLLVSPNLRITYETHYSAHTGAKGALMEQNIPDSSEIPHAIN
jgi:hypothetical protein